jgi:VanZ family protein
LDRSRALPPSVFMKNVDDQPGESRGACRFVRFIAVSYTVVLSYLLLAPEPLFFLGGPGASVDRAVTVSVAGWLQHAAAYAILSCLLLAAFVPNCRWEALLALAVLHGGLTEVIQRWIPHRECDWTDMLANIAGVAFGAIGGLGLLLAGRWFAESPDRP